MSPVIATLYLSLFTALGAFVLYAVFTTPRHDEEAPKYRLYLLLPVLAVPMLLGALVQMPWWIAPVFIAFLMLVVLADEMFFRTLALSTFIINSINPIGTIIDDDSTL